MLVLGSLIHRFEINIEDTIRSFEINIVMVQTLFRSYPLISRNDTKCIPDLVQ